MINFIADSPRIYLSVSKPRVVRKVVMKAFWRNVAFWRRLVVPRLVITPTYITIGFSLQNELDICIVYYVTNINLCSRLQILSLF